MATEDGLDNPELRLIAANGKREIASDEASGQTQTASIRHTPQQGGTFYLAVRHPRGRGTGGYTLEVNEEEDDFPAATNTPGVLEIGVDKLGEVQYPGDRDWFRVPLAAEVTYKIAVERGASPALRSPTVRVFDGDGKLLKTDDDSDGDGLATVAFTSRTGGQFYVEAASNTEGNTGFYRVSVTVPADDFAESLDTTGVLDVGGSLQGEINFDGDRDWLRMRLHLDKRYLFEVRGNSPTENGGTLEDPYLEVLDSTGAPLSPAVEDDNGGTDRNALQEHLVVTDGVYYLVVRDDNDVGTGTYTAFLTELVDDYPDSVDTEGMVPLDSSATGAIDFRSDADWFRVQMQEDELFLFELKGASSMNGTLEDPYMELLDGSGSRLKQDDYVGEATNDRFEYRATEDGPHFVSVRSSGDTGVGSYALFFSRVPDDCLATTGTTCEVPGKGTEDGEIEGEINYAGDHDWIRFTTAEDRTYQIDVKGSSTPADGGTLDDPLVWLVNWEGTLVYVNQSGVQDDDSGTGDNARISFTPGSGNLVAEYIRVTSSSSDESGTGTYTVSVTITEDGSTEDSSSEDAGQYEGQGTDCKGDAGTGCRIKLPDHVYGEVTTQEDSTLVNDSDWFKVYPERGWLYHMSILGVDDDTWEDTELDKMTQARMQIRTGDAVQGDQPGDWAWTQGKVNEGTPLYLCFTAPNSRVRYINVRHRTVSGDDPGAYRLSWERVTDDYPETAATTGAVSPGSSVTGKINYDKQNDSDDDVKCNNKDDTSDDFHSDEDWLKLNLEAGKGYTIQVRGSDSSPSGGTLGEPVFSLRERFNGRTTWWDGEIDGTTGTASLLFGPRSDEDIFIMVRDKTRNSVGTYTVDVTEITTDDYAASDSTTGTVDVGGSATGTIDWINDVDWVKVDLAADTAYRIDVLGESSGADGGTLTDPYMRFYNPSGKQVGSDDDGGNARDSRLFFTPGNDGTFYIAVSRFADNVNGPTGTYTVKVTSLGDDQQPNKWTSASIAVDGSMSASIIYAGDKDWFKVDLEEHSTYRFDVRGDSDSDNGGTLPDPFLELRDPDGKPIAPAVSDNDSGEDKNARAVFTPPRSGAYFLAARSNLPNQSGTYTAQVTLQEDDFNSDLHTLGAVRLGVDSEGKIGFAADADWFRVAPDADRRYRFTVRGGAGSDELANPFLRVVDADGNDLRPALSSGSTGNTAQVAYEAGDGDVVYIIVTAADGVSTGSYTVGIELASRPEPSGMDWAASADTLGVLIVDDPTFATLDSAADVDWFVADVPSGGAFEVDVGGAIGTDVRLRAYRGRAPHVYVGRQNDRNGSANRDPLLRFLSQEGGKFYFVVESADTSSSGYYTIGVYSVPDDVIPADSSTAATLAVGGNVTEQLQLNDDEDWFSVTLSANTAYTFKAEGAESGNGTLGDPYLQLMDSDGTVVASNDNASGSARDAEIAYTPSIAGTYYVSVKKSPTADTYNYAGAGTYKLSLSLS